MMRQIIATGSSLLVALGLLFAFASSAHAVSMPLPQVLQAGTTYRYQYQLTDPSGMRSARDGQMDLRFTSDNLISGRYDPDAFIAVVPITGSRTGNQFWLDIGSSTMHLMHVTGTINPDGSLVGYSNKSTSSHVYAFRATLVKSNP